ncbi:MAG: thiamine-phosphate kinase [Planctomycetes bacterium]|nr:thiamine-phosphate kinase [Planctomycetota bacterium]
MEENEILAWIAQSVKACPSVPIGVGDDMAAVRLEPRTGTGTNLALLKMDQALDQVHFDLRQHTPCAAGRKAVNRCLSDCAAMACIPAAILIAVALPRTADMTMMRELFKGCQAAAAAFNCPIVGGDTAIWDQRLAITVAAMGLSDQPVRRSGARAGDALCVTGKLGGSILGRHMDFTPRINLAHRLAGALNIHAMMDISDGLAMDLPRLMAASKTGASIDGSWVPIHEDAQLLARRDHQSALYHALCDGEDYELLFAVDFDDARQLVLFDRDVPISIIGRVTAAHDELVLVDDHGQIQSWPKGGWEYKGDGRQ